MKNPWNTINLDDYENHMKLNSVMQLQVMNEMMDDQFYRYPVATLMILGIAGGNGLNHIDPDRIQKVYGVDVNQAYLRECVRRYPGLNQTLIPIQADLQKDEFLPRADLVIANLLIEYIGYLNFQRAVQQGNPRYVSCIIQINTDSGFVSHSPYVHVFDCLEAIHHQIDEHGLSQTMRDIQYGLIYKEEKSLPNGKSLLRLDYQQYQVSAES